MIYGKIVDWINIFIESAIGFGGIFIVKQIF